jgi:hypothetical protein
MLKAGLNTIALTPIFVFHFISELTTDIIIDIPNDIETVLRNGK